MVNPASGPLLFDTSAESWLAWTERSEVLAWMQCRRLRIGSERNWALTWAVPQPRCVGTDPVCLVDL